MAWKVEARDAITRDGRKAFYLGRNDSCWPCPWIFKIKGETKTRHYSIGGFCNNHQMESHETDLVGPFTLSIATHPGSKALNEIVEGLEGVTPGPWKTGRLGDVDRSHVVDFGEPPSAPFMVVRKGHPATGVIHSDNGSSVANASHIARCHPDAIRSIAALVADQDAELKDTRLERQMLSDSLGDQQQRELDLNAEIERLRGGGDNSPDKESPDIPTQLRALAADQVASTYAYGRDLRKAATEIERLTEHNQELIDASGQECGCGYDDPNDVCLGHLPKFKRLEAENTRLRAALANSDQPCAYCSLPADEWNKCESGFPGCDRADDAMGCPHLGSGLENARLREALELIADGHIDTGEMSFKRKMIARTALQHNYVGRAWAKTEER